MTGIRSGKDTAPGSGRKDRRVGVVPLGSVPTMAVEVIGAHISGYMKLEPRVLPDLDAPEYAFDPRRNQYDAAAVIRRLESEAEAIGGCWKLLAVVDADLFVPIFTYVFGEARQGGTCAVVSLFRLRKHTDGSTPPPSVILERAAKVALHELGHLMNVFHCDDPHCLMHFTGGVADLDVTPLFFCRYCSVFLRDAAAGGGQGRSDRSGS